MKLFRNVSAAIGALLFFGAAGTDEMYVEMGEMPPNSVTALLIIGGILLIPMVLRLIGMAKTSIKK
jgi:hypothetical protein